MRGPAPSLDTVEARRLLDAIDTGTPAGLRDRALIGVMSVSGCSARAALRLRVGDVAFEPRGGARFSVQEEDGPAPLQLGLNREVTAWLLAYVRQSGLAGTPLAFVWRANAAGQPGQLLARAMTQQEVFDMVLARAGAAGIRTRLGFGAFRRHGLAGYFSQAEWLAQDKAETPAPRAREPAPGWREEEHGARRAAVPGLGQRL
ncbi:hypothetical protein [Azohydromonas aeria]|uniref:hypothetical protein n=1 Tax=Azohydromonas aeria TaxID=2590212 RepID=UPI0012FABDE9|nr:hypothetical protein [Azohydromonas aeria]